MKIANCVAVLIALSFAASAQAYPGQKLENQAKITMDQATRIALKVQPGKVTSRELEHESGGSGLRYSFDIKQGNVTHEVGIDAKTGAVLEDSVEGPDAD